jgi:CRP/FNR family transcriptional regulator, dissimilatory nitrate respiration regulator
VPDCFGIVLEGHTRAVHYSAEGRPITMFVSWPGQSFAVMAALTDRVLEADVEAAETTTIACVPKVAVEALLEKEPHVTRSILRALADQSFEIMKMAKSLGTDVSSRLAHYIRTRATDNGQSPDEPITVDLGVTRAELAAQLGTVPETLSRVFASLAESAVIEAHGRQLTIVNPGQLAYLARGIAAEPHQGKRSAR